MESCLREIAHVRSEDSKKKKEETAAHQELDSEIPLFNRQQCTVQQVRYVQRLDQSGLSSFPYLHFLINFRYGTWGNGNQGIGLLIHHERSHRACMFSRMLQRVLIAKQLNMLIISISQIDKYHHFQKIYNCSNCTSVHALRTFVEWLRIG